MQKHLFFIISGAAVESLCKQHKIVGLLLSTETLVTEETVAPAFPKLPSVVTI
jgi:hypothetical protein